MAKYLISDDSWAEIAAKVKPWPDNWYVLMAEDNQWVIETDDSPETAEAEELVAEREVPRPEWLTL